MMRTFIFLSVILTSFPAFAQISERLSRLNTMFEGNLTGAAYAVYCGSQPISSYPVYISNTKATIAALADEMMRLNAGMSAQSVAQSLTQKQAQMERALGQFYQKRGACQTSQAQAARKHFELFNGISRSEMDVFLTTIEKQ